MNIKHDNSTTSININKHSDVTSLIDLNLIENCDTVGDTLNVSLKRKNNLGTFENRKLNAIRYRLCSSIFALGANAVRREMHSLFMKSYTIQSIDCIR